jgi:hypothetical protein
LIINFSIFEAILDDLSYEDRKSRPGEQKEHDEKEKHEKHDEQE